MEAANILVCEDERLVARDIEMALQRFGYKVVGIAGDGEQALRLAEEHSPDLALMDISLAGEMNGIEVAGILAEKFGIPSIYLTAHADDETLSRAKETLPLSYLLKPFDETELRTAIEVSIYRHRLQAATMRSIEGEIKTLWDNEAIDRAVALEREFMMTERINSHLRVAGNIADRLEGELREAQRLVESAAGDASLRDETRASIQEALSHQERAAEIVDKLLLCSQLRKLHLESIAVDAVIDEAVEEAKNLVGSDLNFVDYRSPEPLVCVIDREKIRQILVSLFENAYHAMDENRVIALGTSTAFEEFPERFNVSAIPGWYVVVKVSDVGRGIGGDDIDRVFEPCFRLPAEADSSGLGLSLAFATMQQHLGWVTVESTQHMGTRVSLYFPSVQQRHGEPPDGLGYA